MQVKLANVRLSFPQLFKPGKFPGYSASFVFPADHAAVKLLKDATVAAAKEEWGDKAAEVYKQLVALGKVPLKDGATKAEHAGYEGQMFVSARTKVKPLVIDGNKAKLSEEDGVLYSGCYVNAVLDVWAQNSAEWGKRINCSLLGVQFLADGEPFSGGKVASLDDFEPVSGAGTGADVFD